MMELHKSGNVSDRSSGQKGKNSNEHVYGEQALIERLKSDLEDEHHTILMNLAHDIKGPINQVEGLLNLAINSASNEEISEILQLALTANRNLFSKVDDLLHAADVNNEQINPDKLVADIWSSLSTVHGHRDVRLIYINEANLSFTGKLVLIRSFLENLLENAIKYRSKEHEQSYVVVGVEYCGGKIILKVTDNGIGIRPANLDKIFEPSYQRDNTKEGYGIGLYLVKQNVLRIGGSIEVESEWNIGTTFTLTFPSQIHNSHCFAGDE